MPDLFERLGLPRRFSVDLQAIEREYLARSREIHPDFHAHNGEDESIQKTAALNEAYITLKDPFRRAEYYLVLLGGPTAREEKGQDQLFLMEMMDIREQIELAGQDSIKKSKIEEQLQHRLDAIISRTKTAFENIESTGIDQKLLINTRKNLNSARTIQSLLRSLDEDSENI